MFKTLKSFFSLSKSEDKYSSMRPSTSWIRLDTISSPVVRTPPPSYDQVLGEKLKEIRSLEAEALFSEQKYRKALKKYLYTKSSYLNATEDLRLLDRTQEKLLKRCLRKGRPIPCQQGYRLYRRLIIEEITYLKDLRSERRGRLALAQADEIRTRSRLVSLQKRLNKETHFYYSR